MSEPLTCAICHREEAEFCGGCAHKQYSGLVRTSARTRGDDVWNKLEAENARLRAALEQILNEVVMPSSQQSSAWEQLVGIGTLAKAALGPEGGEERK